MRWGNFINWALCKKLKFEHTIRCYLHEPESFLENETHKILLDFEIRALHVIPARRPDLVIINKKKRKRELTV